MDTTGATTQPLRRHTRTSHRAITVASTPATWSHNAKRETSAWNSLVWRVWSIGDGVM